MKIQDLIKLFRKQVSDEAAPYLWDDVEVLQYVIDAQDIFVRRMGGFSKSTVASGTTEINDLVLTVSTPTTAFSPYILRIRSARLLTAQKDVRIISEADFGQIKLSDYGQISPLFMSDTDTGNVSHAIIGLEDGKLRWYKVPDTADTCRLHMYRLPYPRIASQEDELEIDEQHHLHLVKWIKHLAYSKEDAETYDGNLAVSNGEAFEKYCETAAMEKDRQRFKPRVVQYGGI